MKTTICQLFPDHFIGSLFTLPQEGPELAGKTA